jgi:hypothetical protein
MKKLSTAACLAVLALSFGTVHAADVKKDAPAKATEAKAAAKAASDAASKPAAKADAKKKEKKGGC